MAYMLRFDALVNQVASPKCGDKFSRWNDDRGSDLFGSEVYFGCSLLNVDEFFLAVFRLWFAWHLAVSFRNPLSVAEIEGDNSRAEWLNLNNRLPHWLRRARQRSRQSVLSGRRVGSAIRPALEIVFRLVREVYSCPI